MRRTAVGDAPRMRCAPHRRGLDVDPTLPDTAPLLELRSSGGIVLCTATATSSAEVVVSGRGAGKGGQHTHVTTLANHAETQEQRRTATHNTRQLRRAAPTYVTQTLRRTHPSREGCRVAGALPPTPTAPLPALAVRGRRPTPLPLALRPPLMLPLDRGRVP